MKLKKDVNSKIVTILEHICHVFTEPKGLLTVGNPGNMFLNKNTLLQLSHTLFDEIALIHCRLALNYYNIKIFLKPGIRHV